MATVNDHKAAGYLVRPVLDGGEAAVFVPGLGGRARFVNGWNVSGAEPVIRRATWNQPMSPPPLEDRGASLAALVVDSGVTDVVLIGHSMGALVCLEAARRLERRLRGVVFMCQNPPHRTPLSELVDLPDVELAEQLDVAPHVKNNSSILGEFAQLWRSEYRFLNCYLRSDPRPLLTVPIIAVGATLDPSSNNVPKIEDWKDYTTDWLDVQMIEGGHQVVEELSPETVRTWVRKIRD